MAEKISTIKLNLIVERDDLNTKLEKLIAFINDDIGKFQKLDKTHQGLLRIQALSMETYSNILSERINHL